MRLEIVEVPTMADNQIIQRWPTSGSVSLQWGSQLIVRENQIAIFFRDGRALDVFEPGRYTLSTQNIPGVTRLLTGPLFGSEVPFKSEVIFLNRKAFLDLLWGTDQPILYRDTELDMVQLRAHGAFSCRVADAQLFVQKTVGNQGFYSTEQIAPFLGKILSSRFSDLLSSFLKSLFDLPGSYEGIAAAVKSRTADDLGQYGLEILTLVVSSITAPDDVQIRINERTAMKALGDMGQYTKFKTAQAIEKAAESGAGGAANLGAGIGVGAIIAAQMLKQTSQSGTTPKLDLCPGCKTPLFPGANFCANCGQKTA